MDRKECDKACGKERSKACDKECDKACGKESSKACGKVDQQLQVVATVTKMFPLDPWLPFQKILSPFLGSGATPSKWVQGATWRW
jgi:hypothetical protein